MFRAKLILGSLGPFAFETRHLGVFPELHAFDPGHTDEFDEALVLVENTLYNFLGFMPATAVEHAIDLIVYVAGPD